MPTRRTIKRTAGMLTCYFSDELLRLAKAADGRSKQGRRWKDPVVLLKAVLLGLAAGCKGLGEVEDLTAVMFKGARRRFGLPKRLPDTTLRSFLCKLNPSFLCQLIYVVGYDAWRRKAFRPLEGFDFHAISMDGKYPTISDTSRSQYLQVRHDGEGNATHGLVRTITSTLVTAAGRPLLGACMIPGHTNEKGWFQKALGDLVRYYGRLFSVVMYDAGAASEKNAEAVKKAGKDYLFQIADPRWTMYETMMMLFADKRPDYVEEVKLSEKKTLVRELTLLKVVKKNLTCWKHDRAQLQVRNKVYEDGVLKSEKVRYFATSIAPEKLSVEKFLKLIVLRWGVETTHQVLDMRSAFEEDDRPWIRQDAKGALAVMLLRRVAYTMMTLYRSVTLRSDNATEPWRVLMMTIKDTLKWPGDEVFLGLRTRTFALPKAFRY